MKNCKGFTLLDAMVGMSIFMFTIIWIIPILLDVYAERSAIRQEEYAIELCHNLLQDWKNTNVAPEQGKAMALSDVEYDIHWSRLPNSHIEICVDWTGANGRSKSICGEAK